MIYDRFYYACSLIFIGSIVANFGVEKDQVLRLIDFFTFWLEMHDTIMSQLSDFFSRSMPKLDHLYQVCPSG